MSSVEPGSLPVRAEVSERFEACWADIAGPGAWFTGADRLAIVAEARNALDCNLCAARRTALSPESVSGAHQHLNSLPSVVVDVIHRMRTDPGRLTRRWFDGVMDAGLEPRPYVELVGVVAASVVMDSFTTALGLGPRALPPARPGAPTGQPSDPVVDDGAFVPIMDVPKPEGVAAGRLPPIPNIARALALVPSARELFFAAFRPHYALQDMDLELTRPQTELIAARVSAINQCFY